MSTERSLRFKNANANTNVKVAERMKKPLSLTDTLEGNLIFDFGYTINSRARRDEFKKAGLKGDALKEAMAEIENNVEISVDLSGLTVLDMLENLAASFAIKARPGFAKIEEHIGEGKEYANNEEADKAFASYTADTLERTINTLANTMWHTPRSIKVPKTKAPDPASMSPEQLTAYIATLTAALEAKSSGEE